MACRAAVLASDRAYHQPIRRKDMIPTPSHPIKSWNMLFAVMMVSMAMRKMSRCLMNLCRFGSVDIYHSENSTIDHVINRAIGINVSEIVSITRLILMLIVVMLIMGGDEMVISFSLFSSELRGIRLIMNDVIRLFFVL